MPVPLPRGVCTSVRVCHAGVCPFGEGWRVSQPSPGATVPCRMCRGLTVMELCARFQTHWVVAHLLLDVEWHLS